MQGIQSLPRNRASILCAQRTLHLPVAYAEHTMTLKSLNNERNGRLPHPSAVSPGIHSIDAFSSVLRAPVVNSYNAKKLRGVPHLCRLRHRPWNQSDKWGQRLGRQAFRHADMHTAPTSCPRLQNYGPGNFSAVANTAGDAKTGKTYNSNWRPRLIAASTLFCSWRSLLSIAAEWPSSARHWSRS